MRGTKQPHPEQVTAHQGIPKRDMVPKRRGRQFARKGRNKKRGY